VCARVCVWVGGCGGGCVWVRGGMWVGGFVCACVCVCVWPGGGALRVLVDTLVVKIKAAHAVPCIVKNGKPPLHILFRAVVGFNALVNLSSDGVGL